MSVLLPFMDIVGVIGFLIAAVYAYHNHANIKFASNMWFYFATAAVMAAVWSFVVLLKELDTALPVNVEPSLFFAVVFIFTLFSAVSFFSVIKPLEEK